MKSVQALDFSRMSIHNFQNEARSRATVHLPSVVAPAIWGVREHRLPGLLLRGLPLDAVVPPPPDNRRRPLGKGSVSEAVLVGISAMMGDVYGFRQDRTGPIVHEIAPLSGSNVANSADGNGGFGMHVDKSVFPLASRPEWLALFGLVNDENVPTQVLFCSDVLRQLNPTHLESLRRKEFLFPQTNTLDFGPGRITSGPGSVIESRLDGSNAMRFAEYSTVGITAEAQDALDALRDCIRKTEPTSFLLEPGTLLIVDNGAVLHGRGSFKGRRWLQRVYSHSGLDQMRKVVGCGKTEHILDARPLLLS